MMENFSTMPESQIFTSKGNILIVDDNPTNLLLLSNILIDEGYNVRCALDSKMVVEGVKACPPDLILLDVVMPEMNGFQVCKLLKADEQIAHIPVLFISAFDDLDSKVQAFQAGGVDYITKPFQYQEVLARVKTQLTLFQQHNELIQHRQNLEGQVLERTREISDINHKLLWEINERIRAEGELQDLQRYNELILESAGEGICGIDRDCNIISINNAGANILGWDKLELIGKHFNTITNAPEDIPSTPPPEVCSIYHSIRDGQEQKGDDQLFWRKDGISIPVDYFSAPLFDESHTIIGAVITFQEIIERKIRDRHREITITIAYAMRKASTRRELGKQLLSNLTKTTSIIGGAIFLHDSTNKEITVETAIGNLEHIQGRHFQEHIGISEDLLKNGQPLVIDNGFQGKLLSQILPGASNLSVACVPFIAQKEILGFLLICSSGRINNDDFSLIKAIADMTASTLKRISLHEQTERRLEQLEALRAIDQAILSNFDLRITLRLVIQKAISLLKVDNVVFLLFDEKNDCFEYLDGSGLHLIKKPKKITPKSDHIAKIVVDEKNTVLLSLENEDKSKWLRHYIHHEDLQGYAGLPLIAKDRVIGILEIYHRLPLIFDQEQLNFLETLAGQSAIAIDNVILFESMKEINIHLKQSYDATIEGWARALELRDQETEGHTRRVTELTVLLSKAIGLPDNEIEHIRIGAILHDVGKMGIPDHILLKPGRLSSDEWEVIKRHTIYGYEMLLPIEFLSKGLDVVYYHHEKWDGTGYPTGKKGQEIPLPARIFCIVDVWDALTSERPYKKAWSKEEALRYIQEQTGKQFDPHVAGVFIQIINERF